MLRQRSTPTACLVVAALALAPGCWLFKSSEPAKPPEDAGASQPETKKDDLAETAAKLKEAGYPVEESKAFTTKLQRFPGSKGTRDSNPDDWAIIDQVLEGALAANPEPDDQYTLHATWALVYGRNGIAEAQTELLAALAIKPTSYILETLRDRPDAYGDIHAQVCAGLRPGLDEHFLLEEQLEFYEQCDEWVEGDHSKLWPNAKKDYAAIPKLKKKIAAYEAEQKAFAQEIAAYFPGGGKCIDNACEVLGWRSFWDEEVESKCVSDDCFGVGWESATPKGPVSTRCIDNDCLGEGWKTTGKDGTWVGKCNDEECGFSGWTVKKGSKAYVVTTEDEGRTYMVKTPKKKLFECTPRAQSGKGILAGMDCIDAE